MRSRRRKAPSRLRRPDDHPLWRYAAPRGRERSAKLSNALADGADIVVVGFEANDPTGYGRLLLDATRKARRHSRGEGRERRGARDQALQFRHHGLPQRQDPDGPFVAYRQRQRQREFYLTDAIALAKADGLDTHMLRGTPMRFSASTPAPSLRKPKQQCSSACATR